VDPKVVIIVGGTVDELGQIFNSVMEAARVDRPFGVEEEQDVPIHICRDPRQPLGEVWRNLGPEWG
jgi:hypothetical protein